MLKDPIKIDFQDTQKEGNRAFFNLLDPLLWKKLRDQIIHKRLVGSAGEQEMEAAMPDLLQEMLEHR